MKLPFAVNLFLPSPIAVGSSYSAKPVPASFARNIVTGKRYGTDGYDGRYRWDAIAERSALVGINRSEPAQVGDAPITVDRYGLPKVVRPRLGQRAFRFAVTNAFERRCAVSGEKTLPIFDTAHIRSNGEGGDHDPANGMLLRAEIHRLFDLDYVTVSDDRYFEVTHRLKASFDKCAALL